MARVDQWVPALHRGDAIGDSARLMRDALRRAGHQADVYALDMDDDLRGDGRPFGAWQAGGPDDVVLLHYALPSVLNQELARLRSRRVLIHHNVTPAEFFDEYDPEMARICRLARAELPRLRDHVDLALGDSEFNRQELAEAGYPRTGVLPIYVDFARYRQAPSPVLLRQLRDGRVNLLFVGRVAPNKRQEDLLRLGSYWKRFISPNVRLVFVGKLPRRETGAGEPLRAHYFDALQRMFYELGFTASEVLFTGHLDHPDLLACYAAADVFVSMSAHEGFGVPLVEAMLFDVPVLARRAAAVPHTLGGAGVQFGAEADLDEVAEMAHALASDAALRTRVVAAQRRRLEELSPAAVEAHLHGWLRSLSAA